MLTGKGVTAWRHALAGLAPATSTTPAAPAGLLPATCPPALPSGLAAELINVLAALALTTP